MLETDPTARKIGMLADLLTDMVNLDLQIAVAANVRQNDPKWWVTRVALGAATHQATVRSRRDNRPIARVESCSGDDEDPHEILDGYKVAEHIAHWDVQAVIDECHAKQTMLRVLRHNRDPLTLEILQRFAHRYGYGFQGGEALRAAPAG